VLKENLWPALKFTQGENRALFTNYMGATVPLSVKIVSASVIIMAELRVGDAHFNFERRKVNRIESYKTTCFEMNMQIGGRTWYEVLGEIARNAGGWDPNIPTPFTGTIVQIEYEIFTDPDPTGAIGAEVVQPVQRYYGYTSKDCQSGYNEFSTIQLKWVKAITGQWPNP